MGALLAGVAAVAVNGNVPANQPPAAAPLGTLATAQSASAAAPAEGGGEAAADAAKRLRTLQKKLRQVRLNNVLLSPVNRMLALTCSVAEQGQRHKYYCVVWQTAQARHRQPCVRR